MRGNPQDFPDKAPPDGGAFPFIYPPTAANISFFSDALLQGGFVAIPTETVYGLAANALDPSAARSIFEIKGRPLVDPLILHLPGPDAAARLAFLPETFAKLAKAFWPGPLTLILRKKPLVPDIITAGKETVALRIPAHPVAQNLLKRVGCPLAAPSANPFGYVSPTTARHVTESFGSRIPFVLDGGDCQIGLESTILDLSQPGQECILRTGAISAEAIAEILGRRPAYHEKSLSAGRPATAPGMFSRHYSPRTTLQLVGRMASVKAQPPETALIFLQAPEGNNRHSAHQYWLSENGDPFQMAHSLFSLLRQLDQAGYNRLVCEVPPPEATGLLKALRDRLLRAASD